MRALPPLEPYPCPLPEATIRLPPAAPAAQEGWRTCQAARGSCSAQSSEQLCFCARRANIVYCSVVLDRWQRLSAVSLVEQPLPPGAESAARVALAPLSFWALEVVQNYTLIATFGRNTAWCYTGWRQARCHGAVRPNSGGC